MRLNGGLEVMIDWYPCRGGGTFSPLRKYPKSRSRAGHDPPLRIPPADNGGGLDIGVLSVHLNFEWCTLLFSRFRAPGVGDGMLLFRSVLR